MIGADIVVAGASLDGYSGSELVRRHGASDLAGAENNTPARALDGIATKKRLPVL